MADPSKKSPEMERFLEETVGRTTAIKNNLCIDPPIGCGGPAHEFRDMLSEKEYSISGFCQACQDKIFIEED